MADSNQKLLTVRMEESFLQQLRVATVARETTIAAVVRQALKDWLSKNQARGGAAKAAKAKAKPARAAKPKAKKATVTARKRK